MIEPDNIGLLELWGPFPKVRKWALTQRSQRSYHGDPMPLLNDVAFVNKLAKFTGLESRMPGSIKDLENLPLNSAQTATHDCLPGW